MVASPLTKKRIQKACQHPVGYRPTSNWGGGELPAPFAEGDLLMVGPNGHRRLDGDIRSRFVNRMRDMGWGRFVVTYATSIGPDDEWYFRVWDGLRLGASDRLHVIPGGPNYMAPFDLVQSADPEGLALRGRMLADGWSYTAPPTCSACGQEITS